MTTLQRTDKTHWVEFEEDIEYGRTTIYACIEVELPIYEATINGHTYSTKNLPIDTLYDLYGLEDSGTYKWALENHDKLENAIAEWLEEPYDEDGCSNRAGLCDSIPLEDLEYDDWEPFEPQNLENQGILELLKQTEPID